MNRNRHAIRRPSLILLSVLLLVTLHVAHAQPGNPPQYDELEIIFLVDQSGSMGGTDHTAAHDPDGLRFEAVQYALSTLSEYHHVVLRDTTLRMAVIHFGDGAQTGLDWRVIDSQDPQWATTESALLNQLSQSAFGTNDLGNTNFKAAFQTAATLFNTLPNDNTARLKIIVVLTDGAPCAPYDPEWIDPNCTSPADQVNHMNDLLDFAQINFPAPDYRIYILAIDANDTYWPRFATSWQAIVGNHGRAERLEDSTDIGPRFVTILTDVTQMLRGETESGAGTEGDTLGEQVGFDQANTATIDVPPFYQTLRITIFKNEPSAQITITDPYGNVVSDVMPTVSVTGRDSAIEIQTIQFPEPGIWHITTQNATLLDIYKDLLRVNWRLDHPSGSLQPFTPFEITLHLEDADGNPLPNYANPAYALDVSVTLKPDNGPAQNMNLTTAGTGTYTVQIIPEEVGHYALELSATSQRSDGTPFTVLHEAIPQAFDVAPTAFTVTGFPANDMLVSERVTLWAAIADDAGNVLVPEELTVTAQIMDQSGTVWADVPLLQSPDGTFTETVAMTDPGQYRITVRATMTAPSGEERLLGEETSGLFSVDPADFLLIEILAPEDGNTQHATEGLPPYSKTDLTITVRVYLEETGDGVDLADYTADPEPLQLTITTVDGDDVTGNASLQLADEPGIYEATISDLDRGKFTITVVAKEGLVLNQSTLFASRAREDIVAIERTRNPLQIITLVGMITFGVLATLTVVRQIVVTRRRKQHPAVGELVIQSRDGYDSETTVWRVPLNRYRSNHITFKKRSLRQIPPVLGVQKIIVECPDHASHDRGQIKVTVMVKGKKQPQTTRMWRGKEYRLGGTPEGIGYFLVKDPYESDW
ncbi:MAG: VWA domain-containing protein [Anaerolineae bacterium]|nr:VWA domain-containing protein [Anaerolineae bacterium]